MRPLHPTALPAFLAGAPPEGSAVPTVTGETAVELATLTPVIGGGVEPQEPDRTDLVRLPAVRGALRSWWRRLYGPGPNPPDGEVEKLFRREACLWGAVGVTDEENESKVVTRPGARRSRVELRIEILDPGRLLPAGYHEVTQRGLRAVPRWSIGSRLGYALFPLQRTREERNAHRGGGALPTRSVRENLRFRLRLSVRGEERVQAPSAEDMRQVLASLWAWVHLSGLGARTRRGFGALRIVGSPAFSGLTDRDRESWLRAFHPPRADELPAWLEHFFDLSKAAEPGLGSARFLTGRAAAKPGAAHEELLDLLQTFRQGEGMGRDPGRGRPGRSRWPEGDLLRVRADREGWTPYEHPPTPEVRQAVAADEVGVPRAAFGLPLLVRFKDRMDGNADATFYPAGTGNGRNGADPSTSKPQRWASPLLLRPLALSDGRFAPLAVVLPDRPPEKLRLEFAARKPEEQIPWKRPGGARPPIADYLGRQRGEGDGVEAFALWLEDEKRYRTIRPLGRKEQGRG